MVIKNEEPGVDTVGFATKGYVHSITMATKMVAGFVQDDLMTVLNQAIGAGQTRNFAANNSYFHYFPPLQNILSRTSHGQRR